MHQALGLCSLLNFRSFLDGHPDSRSVSWEIFQLLFSVTWWLGGVARSAAVPTGLPDGRRRLIL